MEGHVEEQDHLQLICTIIYTVFSKNISVTDCQRYISGTGFPFPRQQLSHFQADKVTPARHPLGNLSLVSFV